MLGARQFEVDPVRIVHETIEGETILIDLETGIYYSLRGSGAEIWNLLIAGITEAEVVAEMQRRYGSEVEAVAATTEQLIEDLLAENLLELAEPGTEPVSAPPRPESANGLFEPPTLERYTDMEYFLLLDPIHEVHAGGWPQAAAPAAGGALPN